MSQLIGKIWGTTEPLLVTPLIEVHRIEIKPGTKSSPHIHERKWNMFYVLDGSVSIHVKKNDYALVDETVLEQCQFTSVKPGEEHWFQTEHEDDGGTGATVLEIYYLEPLGEDIIRKGVGGLVEPKP